MNARSFIMTVTYTFDSEHYERRTEELAESTGLDPENVEDIALNGKLAAAFELIAKAAGEAVHTRGNKVVSLPLLASGVEATMCPDDHHIIIVKIIER